MSARKTIAAALAQCRDAELAAVLKWVREVAGVYRDESLSAGWAHHRSSAAFHARIRLNQVAALENLADALEKGVHRRRRRASKPRPQDAAS